LNIPYITTSAPTAPKYVLADVSIAVVGAVLGLYIRWIAAPMKRRKPMAGPESLIGDVGVALTDLSPAGEVKVQGIVWKARAASGNIKAGEQVRVVRVEGLTLIVEGASGESQPR
ncbi:MAG: NfeD family protein, partial [Acidilobus sp.]